MFKRITFYASLALITMLSFAGVAFAQSVGDENLLDLAKPVLEAALAGNWWLAIAGLLIVATAAFSRYAPWAWAKSGAGKAATVLVFSFGGALATLLAGSQMSPALAYAALKIALSAAGGYSLLRALLVPALEKLKAKLPKWAHPLIDLALWAFKDPKLEAEAAGEAAVAANPGKGLPEAKVVK